MGVRDGRRIVPLLWFESASWYHLVSLTCSLVLPYTYASKCSLRLWCTGRATSFVSSDNQITRISPQYGAVHVNNKHTAALPHPGVAVEISHTQAKRTSVRMLPAEFDDDPQGGQQAEAARGRVD